MFEVNKETVSMHTRDGVRLDADVYRPEVGIEFQFPVLLMRQPYGRSIASTVVYAHPSWYAAHGYIVAIQDVRGRGTSEGEFNLFDREREDGLDAVNWASQLPGSTGNVGMYGFSYQGMTQLYAAVYCPRALKVICPAMVAYDLYADWAYENNAFCLQANLSWAIQVEAETARLRGDESAYQKFYSASRNLPLYDRIPANPNLLKELAPESFYHKWLDYPNTEEYWHRLSPKHLIQDLDLPMLHIGGWFDPYLRGTLNLYQEMATRSQFPQKLIVGPWAHLPWGRKLGEIDYGKKAISSIDLIQLKWFNKFLKELDTKWLNKPPICLFEMGSNKWRYFDRFANGKKQYFYLYSQGLTGIQDGKLVKKVKNKAFNSNIKDTLVHDPWRPVPSLGGHAAIPAGSFDRSSLDCRSDLLTYTSKPLKKNLRLLGEIIVSIYCTSDAPSFDLCAVLSEVYKDGRVYNFTQGYIRVDKELSPVSIPLQPTCISLRKGNCLRLSLSGACFPAYAVNSGIGKPHARTADHEGVSPLVSSSSRLIDARIITLTLELGGDRRSQIELSTAQS